MLNIAEIPSKQLESYWIPVDNCKQYFSLFKTDFLKGIHSDGFSSPIARLKSQYITSIPIPEISHTEQF